MLTKNLPAIVLGSVSYHFMANSYRRIIVVVHCSTCTMEHQRLRSPKNRGLARPGDSEPLQKCCHQNDPLTVGLVFLFLLLFLHTVISITARSPQRHHAYLLLFLTMVWRTAPNLSDAREAHQRGILLDRTPGKRVRGVD